MHLLQLARVLCAALNASQAIGQHERLLCCHDAKLARCRARTLQVPLQLLIRLDALCHDCRWGWAGTQTVSALLNAVRWRAHHLCGSRSLAPNGALGFRVAGNYHGERARWSGAAGARLKARPGPARHWSSAGKPQHQQGQQLRFPIAYVRTLALLLRAGSGAASRSKCLPEGQGLAGSRRRGRSHSSTGRGLPGPCAGRLLAHQPPRVHAMHAPDT